MNTYLIAVLIAALWYEGYLSTMRFISATGGFREAMDFTLTYASRKDYYVAVAVFKFTAVLMWPVFFMVKAIALAIHEE